MDGTVKTIEPPLPRPVVPRAAGLDLGGDVPLAGHVRRVAGSVHHLGDGADVFVQVALVAGEVAVAHHVPDAGLVRVSAGEQRGAGGAAAAGVVKLGEPHAALSECVEVGRVDLTAVTANIAPAHIIGHGDDDIGPLGRECRGGQGQAEKAGRPPADRSGNSLPRHIACWTAPTVPNTLLAVELRLAKRVGYSVLQSILTLSCLPKRLL